MKKFIAFTLTIVMILTMSVTLVGCDFDLGGLFGGLFGGIIGGDLGNTETQTDTMKTKKEIENALGDNYEITLKFGYTSSEDDDDAAWITTKRVGDAVYTTIADADDEINAYLIVGNKAYSDYDEESDKLTQCTIMGADTYNPYTDVVKQIMSEYENEIEYNSKKSDTMLGGRSVTVYNRTESYFLGVGNAKYEWEYAIDNATGLCLKREISFGGSSIEGSASMSLCFIVTKMTIGGLNMTEEMKKIAIDEWPTSSDFATFGINNIAKVDGKLVYSKAMVTDEGKSFKFEYYYNVTNSSIFNTLSQAFYNAGFNKDYDCVAATMADLSSIDEYSSSFEGYIGEEDHYSDYSVEVLLQPSFNEGVYTLYLKLYNNKVEREMGL